MNYRWWYAVAALTFTLTACQSGSSQSCGFNGATELAATTWPKFRADAANTGRAAVDLSTNDGSPAVLFQARCSVTTSQSCTVDSECPEGQVCMAIGPIVSSPVLGGDPPSIFLGSTDGTVYRLSANGLPSGLPAMTVVPPILGTPLVGANGAIFVPAVGSLVQFFGDNSVRNSTSISGVPAGSPNIWSAEGANASGTVYLATSAGILSAACPNGVVRYSASVSPTQSTPAVVQDPNAKPGDLTPIIVSGGANGLVRAFDRQGRQYWSFLATNTIIAAIVVDVARTPAPVFYTADTNGRVFAANLSNGQLVDTPPFSFVADAAITASPALGRDGPSPRLYVADLSGTLYAIDRATGETRWTFHAAGPISASPAVATAGPRDIVVIAADIVSAETHQLVDSRIYAVRDDGEAGVSLWRGKDGRDGMPACGLVGNTSSVATTSPTSSPALAPDGTVLIGLQSVANTAYECAAVVETGGGALVAFGSAQRQLE